MHLPQGSQNGASFPAIQHDEQRQSDLIRHWDCPLLPIALLTIRRVSSVNNHYIPLCQKETRGVELTQQLLRRSESL